nr:pseudomurein-binding repeat-containing protein [Methanothermobacter thermautotrophicus]
MVDMRQLSKASVYLTMALILIVAMEGSYALENDSESLNSSEVLQASVRVANFMEKYQRLPENISTGNRSLDCASYT